MDIDTETLASYIDHTNLSPKATICDIKKLCDEAIQYSFKTVCVTSHMLEYAIEQLQGHATIAISVIGFPTGKASTSEKADEATRLVKIGASELDMVINIEALKTQNYSYVYEDIYAVVVAAKPVPIKVIIETCYLDNDEKVIACALAKAAGAAFVKTSTGCGSSGATQQDISLMRKMVGTDMGVKASGSIRTYNDAITMIQAGANRLGTSSSIKIMLNQT
jgi:deoxyribose-phosphate aldolase